MAAPRVAERRLQHVAKPHGAVVAQDHHVSFERAGNARREKAGARHDVEAEMAAVVRNRRTSRRRPLPADDLRRAFLRIIDDDRHVAARTTKVRLYDLQRECGGDACVERIAAFFQDRHADGRRDPVRRRADAESTFDLRARSERAGIDVRHRGRSGRIRQNYVETIYLRFSLDVVK